VENELDLDNTYLGGSLSWGSGLVGSGLSSRFGHFVVGLKIVGKNKKFKYYGREFNFI
jgi:hypothetical protein